MISSDETWAVYGIVAEGKVNRDEYIGGRAAAEAEEAATSTQSTSPGEPSEGPQKPTPLIVLSNPSATANTSPSTVALPTPSHASSSTPTPDVVDGPDKGVKIGVGIIGGVLCVALIIYLVEACYLRRRRHARALERARNEVEKGELSMTTKGGEDIIVLESRVSIVFDDSDSDDEDLERGRNGGRNGLSLPRRGR